MVWCGVVFLVGVGEEWFCWCCFVGNYRFWCGMSVFVFGSFEYVNILSE